MEQDWLMWWGKVFTKIIVSQTVFSWSFVLIIFFIAVGYMFWLGRRGEKEKDQKTAVWKKLFRFRWQEILFNLILTAGVLFVVAALGISITFHAAAFSEGMTNRCVKVEETNESFIFTMPPGCSSRELLWNQVQLEKSEGQEAFDFLTKR